MIFFTAIGFATCVALVGAIIVVLFALAKDYLAKLKYRKAMKHRFDKPPLAKCYCIDCKSYSYKGDCRAHTGWMVADNWFCWCADPLER